MLVFLLLVGALAQNATAQGTLTNGWNHQGSISPAGDSDVWTLPANHGDHFTVQIAKLTGGAGFTPRIEVFAPSGATLGVKSNGVAGRLDIQADLDGDYTVMVSDAAQTGTGTYALRLAQVPGNFVVPAGDEGGPLTNGVNHLGTIDQGDLDQWTFTANQGDRIALQVAELSGGAAFSPMIELFGPDGARVEADSGGVTARVDAQAEIGGTYTVLISDLTQTGSGTYQLQLAQSPGAITVPAGDEGGALSDGVDQDGTITLGDLDLWSFTAVPGDQVTLQLTELTGGAGFTPKIELFAPNGDRKAVAQNATAATLDAAIEVGGTYNVLVSDATKSGTGTYRLHLTRSPIAPAGVNVLTNGFTDTGAIASVGADNTWTFPASAGDRIVLRVGEITQTGNFTPRIRLQNPSAVQLAQASGNVAAEISVVATNTGTFTVIVDDAVGTTATGTYRLTLAKTPGDSFVAAGDEGGPLTNGVMHTGTIDVGDLDVWTFTANTGEHITLRMGELVKGSSLTPALWLYGPNGALLDSYGASAAAAEVSVRATNSGTFTVVVGDYSGGYAGSGTYQLTLAKTGSLMVTLPTDEGGPLTNGVMHTGMIDVGDLDAWNFTANAGEALRIRMGELVKGSSLTPALWLYGPDGALLDSYGASAAAAEVSARATNSGTFTVVVGDYSGGYAGSGTYQITLAKTGSPIVVSANDEGGPMTNGVMHSGSIDVGDLDVWSFSATAGESIQVRMGELVPGSTLTPVLWLYGPDGTLLDSYGSSAVAAEVSTRAKISGTFTVMAGDYSGGYAGSGTYRLKLAKTGSPIVVSAGDDGGPLTNGVMHTGSIEVGDLDVWNFAATAGDSIQLRMGELVSGSKLTPALWLYGPDGAFLASYGSSAAAAVISVRATNTGTFTVVASDYSGGYAGSGTYRLTLAKTGSPIVVSPGDEGGPLTNGVMHSGTIDVGDLDIWNFSANAGESLVLRMGELVSGSPLTPALWLYGPNGALLDSYGASAAAAEVTFRATNSGVFTVIAGDFSSSYAGSGTYRLTLAKTGSPIVVSSGDESGPLTGAGSYDGMLDVGDLDIWSFTACAGDPIFLKLDELVTGSSLTPWIRLYGRDGVLLNSISGAATAQINRTAPASGNYTVVLGDFSSAYAGSGTYRLTVNGLLDGLQLCIGTASKINFVLTGVGGTPGVTNIVLTSTDVATPVNLWTPVRTNIFDQFGVFTYTNVINRAERERYFYLLHQ